MIQDNRGQQQGGWFVFAAAIFTSSFLIFQVQPLTGKYILPWFGGTPGVWSTCILFFQLFLFAGYAYAHWLTKSFGVRAQFFMHLLLLLCAIALLPITPSTSWKPTGNEAPVLRILLLLSASVGLPYFLLAANGPLLQAWFGRANPGRSPYGLYSLSNVGSLLGLLSYPFFVEPRWSTNSQAIIWSWGFGLFALFWLATAKFLWGIKEVARDVAMKPAPHPSRSLQGVSWLWFALSACSSVLLLATTNQVCIDVAAVPFLWVVPLTLYLLTFIIAFAHRRFYRRVILACLLVASLVLLCYLINAGPKTTFEFQIAGYFGAMFVCCLVCHGELVRLKPESDQLTAFYLWISAGGAAGGLFVALIAPQMFARYHELQVGMVACAVLAVVSYFRDRPKAVSKFFWRSLLTASVLGVIGLSIAVWKIGTKNNAGLVTVQRNFFGVLRVSDLEENGHPVRDLVHGQILHGQQVMDEGWRTKPTSYYCADSGAGLILKAQSTQPRQIGIVGLGAGTLAVWGRAGDQIRFYEINPLVVELAEQYFTFLKDSPATIEFSMGDARLTMERESRQQFDCLIVDEFSSDAIPTHLLTIEAFDIYLRNLREDGILAIHISNRHFSLAPVVRGAALQKGLWLAEVHSDRDDTTFQSDATWVLLSRQEKRLVDVGVKSIESPTASAGTNQRVVLWTDSFSNLLGVLRAR